MRKLKRSIARQNMLRAGYTHLNKKGIVDPRVKGSDNRSIFARNWKKYI